VLESVLSAPILGRLADKPVDTARQDGDYREAFAEREAATANATVKASH